MEERGIASVGKVPSKACNPHSGKEIYGKHVTCLARNKVTYAYSIRNVT